MKRRTFQVNLVLVGLAALWVYLLADNRGRFEAGQRLDSPGSDPGTTAASPRPVSPGLPSDAAAIADNHLFHVDRHNDLPEEDPEALETVSERLPVLMGTMGFGGDDYALMVSSDPNNSDSLYRRLKAGQTLDGYTLVRVETDGVVMRSRSGEVRVGINEKPRKSSARTRSQPRRTSSRRPRSASTSRSSRQPSSARRNAPLKRGFKRYDVPVGTVRDGKRLVEHQTPFGPMQVWVEDKQDKQQ